MSNANVIFDEALDSSAQLFMHPTYRYSKSFPMNTGQTVLITPNSNMTVQFELPTNNQVVNLSKSVLSFTATYPIPAAVNRFNFIHAHPFQNIESISLSTRQGIRLVDVVDVAHLSSMISSICTPIETLSQRYGNTAMTVAASKLTPVHGLTPAWPGVNTAAGSARAFKSRSHATRISNKNGLIYAPISNASVSENDVTGDTRAKTYPQEYVEFFEGLNNQITNITYKLALSELFGTLLAVDKDIFFGQSLILSITWAPTSRHGFYGVHTAWSDDTTMDTRGFEDTLPLAVTCSLVDLCVYNCLETNPDIINKIMNSPTDIIIPYMMTNLLSTTGANTNMLIKYNGLQGKTIARYYWGVFNTTLNPDFTLGLENSITEYYTTVDGIRETDFPLNFNTYDPILFNEPKLEGSAHQTPAHYLRNFVHIADWTGIPPCRDPGTMLNGLALDRERQLHVNATLPTEPATASTQYMFVELRRRLTIANGLINLE